MTEEKCVGGKQAGAPYSLHRLLLGGDPLGLLDCPPPPHLPEDGSENAVQLFERRLKEYQHVKDKLTTLRECES